MSNNSIIKTENFQIKENNIYILSIDICSGIFCPNFFIFKLYGNKWKIIANTSARLKVPLIIKINNEKNKLLFLSENVTIGDLPFDFFDL